MDRDFTKRVLSYEKHFLVFCLSIENKKMTFNMWLNKVSTYKKQTKTDIYIIFKNTDMEATDFNIDTIYNFLNPIIMETFYVLLPVLAMLVGFGVLILPRLLKSDKNIFLRMKNRLFGEFEYHQKDKNTP